MNSRQRRRQLREYRYTVLTEHDEYHGYLEAWEWLNDKYGHGSIEKKGRGPLWFEKFDVKAPYTKQSPWYFAVRWYFKNSVTAMEFALRWK